MRKADLQLRNLKLRSIGVIPGRSRRFFPGLHMPQRAVILLWTSGPCYMCPTLSCLCYSSCSLAKDWLIMQRGKTRKQYKMGWLSSHSDQSLLRRIFGLWSSCEVGLAKIRGTISRAESRCMVLDLSSFEGLLWLQVPLSAT